MGKARILLVDDHELFREGLVALFEAQPDVEVVGEAGDGFEALALARDLQPDLIVMDINMPICDGLEATCLIRAVPDLANTRILMLTVHDEDKKLFAAIKAGANGYFLKSSSSTDFLEGIRAALAGETILPPKLATSLLEEFARLTSRRTAASASDEETDLTQREREVLDLIATGATDKEIAAELSLSVHTVKSHVRSILNKLHVSNRRQAVKRAGQRGMIGDD